MGKTYSVCIINCSYGNRHCTAKEKECVAKRMSVKFNELWVGAEVMLFVLVGATVNIKYALSFGISTVILIFGVMVFRMVGVFMCLIKTRLSRKE